MNDFKSYWQRHVRWARLRKCHFLTAYISEPLVFETIWPALLLLTTHSHSMRALALSCFALQVISNIFLHHYKFKDQETWKSLPYFLIKDAIAPIIWMAGLVSNKVIWRGQSLELRWGGKLGSKYLRSARIRRILRKIPVSF